MAQEHGEGLLHLVHVIGEPSDETAGLQPVQVPVGQRLHLAKEMIAQVATKPLHHQDRGEQTSESANHANHGQREHLGPRVQHDAKVAAGYSDVDDVPDQSRLPQGRRYFQQHEERSRKRQIPGWPKQPNEGAQRA
jgi:hypothetical protein